MTGGRTTSRRDFLRVVGLSTAEVALAACAPAVAPAAGDAYVTFRQPKNA